MKTLMASIAGAFMLLAAVHGGAEEIGAVSTTFKLLGANHKIVIEAFDVV